MQLKGEGKDNKNKMKVETTNEKPGLMGKSSVCSLPETTLMGAT